MVRANRHPVGPDGRPRHALTADGVLFEGQRVLLVRRRNPPDRGRLALPGGFVDGHAGWPKEHTYYVNNGVPRNYHRVEDTVDALDLDMVVRAADFGAAVVRETLAK